MYTIGELVVHGTSGVCVVQDITHIDMSVGDKKKEYYLLVPVKDETGRIYLPVDGKHANVRRALTKDEAMELIASVPTLDEKWVENEKVREMTYKEAIRSQDCRELIQIIKTVYLRTERRLLEGKKSTATDERYMKLAEQNLYGELAYVLGKSQEEIKEMIAQCVEDYAVTGGTT